MVVGFEINRNREFYMLQKILSGTMCFLIVTLCIASATLQGEVATKSSAIKWMTNYEEALNLAKSTSKPMILFFTGSDWCGWCNKLEEEVFDSADFAAVAGDKYVFLRLDFPLYAAQPSQLTAQNKQLQKKYEIKSFPTLVILDAADLQQMGSTGYRAGGGKQYAQHLKKIVDSYNAHKSKMKSSQTQKLSGVELKKLYEKSRELGRSNDVSYLIRQGMESDEKIFFLTERYRFLAEEGQIHQPESAALKRQLISLDPHNETLAHYNIAVIEFEALSQENHKEAGEQNYWELPISPLISYIEKFGRNDKENLWRLEMIISQVYLDRNELSQALNHAQASYNSAPSSVQLEISSAIKNIQTQLSSLH